MPSATRSAGSRSKTRARRSRRRTSGGRTREHRERPGSKGAEIPTVSAPAEVVLVTTENLSDVTTGTDTSAKGSDSTDDVSYADSRDTTEGRVYSVSGGDWDDV